MVPPLKKRSAPALPTAAELDILAVLWNLGMATVREVHNELAKENRYTTTLKTMQVMTEKGLISRSERFGSHVYQASVPKEQTQQQIAGDLLKRAFGGSARSLVMGALAAQPASPQELDEIRGMLDAYAKQKGRSS
jgi:BlaI family transcriptional regulator, penicillinase repressor